MQISAAAVKHTTRTLSGPPSTGAAIAMDGGVADTACKISYSHVTIPNPQLHAACSPHVPVCLSVRTLLHSVCTRYAPDPTRTQYPHQQQALFGFLMVLETSHGSPRVHPSHSPTLAKWRSLSRSASTTSTYFKDALEHLLEDAAWELCSLPL